MTKTIKTVVVFMAKAHVGEFKRYENVDENGANLGWTHLRKKVKYYVDEHAEVLKIVIDSNREPTSNLTPESGNAITIDPNEIRRVVKLVNETIREIRNGHTSEKIEIAQDPEVFFLRHWGNGGGWKSILKGEEYLQNWTQKEGKDIPGIGKWRFFSLSSLRPELLKIAPNDPSDSLAIRTPAGDKLSEFIGNLESGFFSKIARLQDVFIALVEELARKIKSSINSPSEHDARGMIVLSGWEDGEKFDETLEKVRSTFDQASHTVFIVTQRGVRYTNWSEWRGESIVAEVVQKLRFGHGDDVVTAFADPDSVWQLAPWVEESHQVHASILDERTTITRMKPEEIVKSLLPESSSIECPGAVPSLRGGSAMKNVEDRFRKMMKEMGH